ncbi:MAG TPA: hypothetical protein VKZ75_10780 [Cyclobacteriaceae bacterium]|nr:hypothetical protein [Cyclobacteriaceae bacterium]
MSSWRLFLCGGLILGFAGCEIGPDSHDLLIVSQFYDFADSDHGWKGDFSDYPVGDSIAYGLCVRHDLLPANLGDGKGLMISGTNYSDDLFMFIKKRVTGLIPSQEYQVGFQIKFASNAPQGSVGIGGSPGESVYLKAGASAVEPVKVSKNGYYQMNIDKGNQLSGGQNMVLIGNIASHSNSFDYSFVERNNGASFTATSDANGELWLIVGTDSGFEGTTTLYYTGISVIFTLAE